MRQGAFVYAVVQNSYSADTLFIIITITTTTTTTTTTIIKYVLNFYWGIVYLQHMFIMLFMYKRFIKEIVSQLNYSSFLCLYQWFPTFFK